MSGRFAGISVSVLLILAAFPAAAMAPSAMADGLGHGQIQPDVPDVTIELTPYNPPISIPESGGNFSCGIEAKNNEDAPMGFDVWTAYTLPGGGSDGPVFGPARFKLPQGWLTSRGDLREYVSGDMPAGEYTYTVYVGIYPDLVWASDSFTFEKLSGGGWYEQSIGEGPPIIRGIDFTDADTGWAVGGTWDILHTSDGGDTWQTVSYGQPYPHSFYDVSFVDGQTGWVTGGVILHTTDGGASWTEQESDYGYSLYGVSFVDANSGWAVGGFVDEFGGNERRTIEHTPDGGATWVGQLIQFSYFPLSAIHFADALNGCAVGPRGAILHTSDGGSHWVEQASGTSQDLYGVYFVSGMLGWCVGEGGTLLHTTDGGDNWYAQTPGTAADLESVVFTDANTGWIAGTNWNSERPVILHTIDGGNTWHAQDPGTGDAQVFLYDIDFVDQDNGWAGGSLWPPAGAMLHTETGGE
jgi:photosystem II stability/assembly factor-like uncharacterized protein